MDNFPVFQVQEGEWTSPKAIRVAGTSIHADFTSDPAKLQDQIINFRTRADDVFIVSYPKSGTTWMQEILWQLYNDGSTSAIRIFDRVPFLERLTDPTRPDIINMPSPRLLHSHLPYDAIPKGDSELTKCKYIYIARNPKDVAVSFYEFIITFSPSAGYKGPWDFFAKLFTEGKVTYDLWTDHVLGWWKHKDDPNILFLKYEDLKKDLPSIVRSIAQFLKTPMTEELVNRIAEQCTFKGMKKNESQYQLEGGNNLLRKGKIGDWKNYFTPEQNQRFENEVLAKLKGTGLEFDFSM